MVVTDKQIVETLKQQPEAGFRQLMAQYREPIYWHIRRLVVRHDDAQDVAQETFVRGFAHCINTGPTARCAAGYTK